MQRCCPKLQAIIYRYFGENTVQMNKCVLKAVQASITDRTLKAKNAVISDRCRSQVLDQS